MQLNLKRPIIFFDLETTGVNVASDRIVELCVIKVMPNGDKDAKERRINPGIPIPKESSEIHGIYDEDVKDCPSFKEIAKSLYDFMKDCDLAGYNSNKFDVPLLVEEFLRAGIDFEVEKMNLVDVQNIFHKMERRTLSAAYKFYCGKQLVGAHGAMADTKATLEIFEEQIKRYADKKFADDAGNMSVMIKNDMNYLHEFSKRNRSVDLMGRIVLNDDDVEVFNFGKHKGRPVEEVLTEEPGYYQWMMKGDFPLYTKRVLERIKVRMFNKGKI